MRYPRCDQKTLRQLTSAQHSSNVKKLRQLFNDISKKERAVDYYKPVLMGFEKNFNFCQEVFYEVPQPSNHVEAKQYVGTSLYYFSSCFINREWKEIITLLNKLLENPETKRFVVQSSRVMLFGMRAANKLIEYQLGIKYFTLTDPLSRHCEQHAVAIQLAIKLRRPSLSNCFWMHAQSSASLRFCPNLYKAAGLIVNRSETVFPPTDPTIVNKMISVSNNFIKVYNLLDSLNRPSPAYFLSPLHECRARADYQTALKLFRRIAVPAVENAAGMAYAQNAYMRATSLMLSTFNDAKQYKQVIKLAQSMTAGYATNYHFDRSQYALSCVMKAYIALRDLDGGMKFFREIKMKVPMHYSMAMQLAIQNDDIYSALDISKEADEMNLSSSSLRQLRRQLQSRLGETVEVNELSNRNDLVEWNNVISKLIKKKDSPPTAKTHKGFEILDMMEAQGISPNDVTIASSILTYTTTLIKPEIKNRILQLIIDWPSTESFNASIAVLRDNSDGHTAVRLFHKMDALGIERNEETYSKILNISLMFHIDVDFDYQLVSCTDFPRLSRSLIKRHLRDNNFSSAVQVWNDTPINSKSGYMITALLEECDDKIQFSIVYELFLKSPSEILNSIVVRTIASSAALKCGEQFLAKEILLNSKELLDTSAMRTLVEVCSHFRDFKPVEELLCSEQHVAIIERVLIAFYVHQFPEEGVKVFDSMIAAGVELNDRNKKGVLRCLTNVSNTSSQKAIEVIQSMNSPEEDSQEMVLRCCVKDGDVDAISQMIEMLIKINQLNASHVISVLNFAKEINDPEWGLEVLEYVRNVSFPHPSKPIEHFLIIFTDRPDLTSKLYKETPPHLLQNTIHTMKLSEDPSALSQISNTFLLSKLVSGNLESPQKPTRRPDKLPPV